MCQGALPPHPCPGQHDASLHPGWAADQKQTLLLTLDDHARKLLAAVLVPTDTTGHHGQHCQRIFRRHGLPIALDPAGLAWFGHASTRAGRDPRSEFQRAFTALGVTHRVAPNPPAKGRIERRFDTFQNRLVALLAFGKVTAYPTPSRGWPGQTAPSADPRPVLRPGPDPRLRDRHWALHSGRRVHADHPIDFLGRSGPSSATTRHRVTLIHPPRTQFRVVAEPPKPPQNRRPDILGKCSRCASLILSPQPVSFRTPAHTKSR